MHYNHQMQWIMVYMTRYQISTLHKTYSCDYNALSFPHQFPDAAGKTEYYQVLQNWYRPEGQIIIKHYKTNTDQEKKVDKYCRTETGQTD